MDDFLEELKKICLEIDSKGQDIFFNLNGDMSNDLNYMCKSFSKRQLAQLKSLVYLYDRDDVILIARSMFEGALYLSYSFKNNEMSRRWRLFAFVHDIKRINNGEAAPDEVKELIDKYAPEIDDLFKKNNGDYERNWYGNKSIKQIARDTGEDFVQLYDKYYSQMSEYHHWTTSSFGKRYKLDSGSIIETESEEVKLERANSICMALSSAFSTLKVSSELLGSDNVEIIKSIERKLVKLEGTTTRKIDITNKVRL